MDGVEVIHTRQGSWGGSEVMLLPLWTHVHVDMRVRERVSFILFCLCSYTQRSQGKRIRGNEIEREKREERSEEERRVRL